VRILVTGGAGFIGSNICRVLVRRETKVLVLDNFSTGKEENLAKIHNQVGIIKADITDLKTVHKVVQNVDYVLHQAALPSVPRSVKDPLSSNQANVVGTLNILLAARDAGVKRVIYASSSSVYGDSPLLPKKEDLNPAPLSPYAVSKLTGEYYCQVFYSVYGLETVVLRYFNVFGPHQDPTSLYAAVIPKFIQAMLKGEAPTIYGDGEQSRDFTYVDNVVQANILALETKDAAGKILNIACGERTKISGLVSSLNKILGSKIKPSFAPPRPGDVKHSVASISLAKKVLGYQPQISIEEGLERTVEWHKNGP